MNRSTLMRLGAVVLAIAAVVVVLVLVLGGDDDDNGGGTQGSTEISGSLSMIGVWSADEQKSFQAVLDDFGSKYPNVTVKYTSAGDNTPTVLGTAVKGGSPPDLAAIAQPALVADFQEQGATKSLAFAEDTIKANFPEDIAELGTIDGTLYSFVFKAANKSTVWYNTKLFEDAGVAPPEDFAGFLRNAATIKESGARAYSIGGADGWTLTDLFENIYLRQAGPDKYDQLTDHEIAWTDESVKQALRTMARILGDESNIAGGTSGALETEFPTSVSNVFATNPKAAMVIEGDFVPGVVKTDLQPQTDYNVFPFPEVGDTTKAVVGGGDSIVMFKDTPAGRALVEYLASPEAATVWAKRGGFSSANSKVEPSAYSSDLTRTTATAIADADTFRFDMSDLAPPSFGGTPGQGEWKILQDFLKSPSDVNKTAISLEAAAARAYK